MAGTVSGKPQPLILPGSAETNPKHICFSNSHFEVVIYNFKILFPPWCGGSQYFKNTEWIPFHKRRPACFPFLLMFVHFGAGVRFARGLSGKDSKPKCFQILLCSEKGHYKKMQRLKTSFDPSSDNEHFSFRFRDGLQPTGLQKTKPHFLQHNI